MYMYYCVNEMLCTAELEGHKTAIRWLSHFD